MSKLTVFGVWTSFQYQCLVTCAKSLKSWHKMNDLVVKRSIWCTYYVMTIQSSTQNELLCSIIVNNIKKGSWLQIVTIVTMSHYNQYIVDYIAQSVTICLGQKQLGCELMLNKVSQKVTHPWKLQSIYVVKKGSFYWLSTLKHNL